MRREELMKKKNRERAEALVREKRKRAKAEEKVASPID
jgi:predicted GIY-YIG superfamily endonuclease